ncbi:WD40 repeat domain-containing protein [Alteromonas sp. ASW11-19]|uniref:WD40 repeat domain-containing protein n=1 Tax=Alteromonas salexigens TaxID=2982530 RepID=A0ABT2VIZ3_9ALTE|nr:WD40 repeat domain-containing protein [Alteromonas salexigens]MCU7553156.1 WD40 repeat domain-containing protein [Alteromonas salexigens]
MNPFFSATYRYLRQLLSALVMVVTLGGCADPPALTPLSSQQLTTEQVLTARLSVGFNKAYILTRGPAFSSWALDTGRQLQRLSNDQLPENTRDFVISPDESALMTSDGQTVILWERDSLTAVGTLDFQQQLGDAQVYVMAFISNTVLVTGNSDGSIIIADIGNNLFKRYEAHSSEVTKLLVGHQQQMLYSAGNDGKVVATSLQDLSVHAEYTTPFRVTSMVSNADNSLMFISDALNDQVFWQPWQNRVAGALDYWQQYRFFRKGLFIRDDTRLITTSPKTDLTLWRTDTGEEITSWSATSHSMGSAILDLQQTDNGRLITLTSDAVVESWDISGLP